MTIFGECLAQLCLEFQPSKHPFFAKLQIWRPSADQLGALHLVYQSAMHATRAAVYKMPHLDSPALRQRKLRILVDDDGLPGGDTHHYQLTEVFLHIGAEILVDTDDPRLWADEQFHALRRAPLCPVPWAVVPDRGNERRLDDRALRRSCSALARCPI